MEFLHVSMIVGGEGGGRKHAPGTVKKVASIMLSEAPMLWQKLYRLLVLSIPPRPHRS